VCDEWQQRERVGAGAGVLSRRISGIGWNLSGSLWMATIYTTLTNAARLYVAFVSAKRSDSVNIAAQWL
jgi:hypothetical protein